MSKALRMRCVWSLCGVLVGIVAMASVTHAEVSTDVSGSVLVFPKVLALRLEQGETVINFAVRPDGWVAEGPRIVKSSGFQEFDLEAVQAVLRAAPYPRRNDTYRVSMPVIFENPLIR